MSRAKIALADHDQSDYAGLSAEMSRIGALEAERDETEERWFALIEQIG